MLIIFLTEPEASRVGATKQTAMLVEVTGVEQGTFHPTIQVMGTVRPAQHITLSSRVSGKIIGIDDAFTPGGYVQEGETLLRIDPSDYKNMLRQRKNDLQQAVTDLKVEQGRQDVARRDFKLLGDTLTEKLREQNRSLVLREPQLEAAKMQVKAARAVVDQAKLNLARTSIEAPFDALIISRNVNIGSQVAPGDNLARLIGVEKYWVEATVPLSELQRLTFTEDGKKGSPVKIRNRSAWEEDVYRSGYLYKSVGTLTSNTRMARVLINIPDPRAMQPENAAKPPLIIDSFVEVSIKGKKMDNIVRLNRDYIREDNTVWLMKNDRLNIQNINIVFRDPQYAYIDSGITEQAKVITTNLSTVAEGARVRLANADTTVAEQDSLKRKLN